MVLHRFSECSTIATGPSTKAIVMRKIYESAKGEYSRMFEYQPEILRSNPGSSVAVYLDVEYDLLIFKRFYVCFYACKRGFLQLVVGR
jgi:hypothetical protein